MLLVKLNGKVKPIEKLGVKERERARCPNKRGLSFHQQLAKIFLVGRARYPIIQSSKITSKTVRVHINKVKTLLPRD